MSQEDLNHLILSSNYPNTSRINALLWKHAAVTVGIPHDEVFTAFKEVFALLDGPCGPPPNSVPIENDNEKCALCLTSSQGGILLPCGHGYHWEPTDDCVGLQHWKAGTCPQCRTNYCLSADFQHITHPRVLALCKMLYKTMQSDRLERFSTDLQDLADMVPPERNSVESPDNRLISAVIEMHIEISHAGEQIDELVGGRLVSALRPRPWWRRIFCCLTS